MPGRQSQAFWCFFFVRNAKVHWSHRSSFFGRARASHPRQPLQASSLPLFICEGRLTHPAQLHAHTHTHSQKPGLPSHTEEEGGRLQGRLHSRDTYNWLNTSGFFSLCGLSSQPCYLSKLFKRNEVGIHATCLSRAVHIRCKRCRLPTCCQVGRRRVHSINPVRLHLRWFHLSDFILIHPQHLGLSQAVRWHALSHASLFVCIC